MVQLSEITSPITEELPCGPNPDGDFDFENVLASAEGLLPRSYSMFLEREKASFDAATQLKQISTSLDRWRDIRLIVLAAKFSILSGNLLNFTDAICALGALMKERWEQLHPRGLDGDFSLRSANLSALDDMVTIILPLQDAALIKDRRHGAITYRMHMVATGAAQARSKEPVLDRAMIHDAFVKTEDLDALKGIFDALVRADAALKQVRAQFVEFADFEHAPDFDRLAPLLANMAALLAEALHERDPSIAGTISETPQDGSQMAQQSPDGGQETLVAAGALRVPKTINDATQALKAVESYYATREPSSPAVLLIRQAEQLVGKSFVEAMQFLAPALMDKVAIKIGRDSPFALTFAQLKTLSGQGPAAALQNGGNGVAPSIEYKVGSRAEAAAVMELVERYYQLTEPSSPIPLLLERARLFVDRDFSSLLKDILPPAKS